MDTGHEARAARDEGMRRVEDNAGQWFKSAMNCIFEMPRGWLGTGEDLRLYVTPLIGKPHHFNVWGALISQAVERSYLYPTGETRHMRTKKSHARRTPVYSRTKC